MNIKQPTTTAPRLRSSLPGRERWDVEGLKNTPLLAENIETDLKQHNDVIEVTANPATGRVLVVFHYHPDTPNTGIFGKLIQQSIEKTTPITARITHEPSLLTPPGSLFNLIDSVDTEKKLRWKASWLSLANQAFSLTSSALLGGMLASVITGGFTFLVKRGIGPVGQLGLLTGLYFASKTAESVVLYKGNTAWQRYATQVEYNLRMKAFTHVENQDMRYFENQNTGQLISIIHDDAATIRRFLGAVPHSVITKGSATVAVGVIFLCISPVSFVLTLLPGPFIYMASRKYHKKTSQQYLIQGQRESTVKKQLTNSLGGLPVVKSFTAEDYERQKLEDLGHAMKQSTQDAHAIGLRHSELTNYSIVLGCALPVLYGGYQVLQGAMSTPVFMIQNFLVPEVTLSMRGIDREFDLYQTAKASAKRLSDLMQHQPEIINGTQKLPADTIRGEIHFNDISFAYQDSHKIFDGFNLHIPAHHSVALVGATGLGKSTLLKLLLRFYDVNDGKVLLDDHNIRDLDLKDLRQSIGLVSQDVFLFEGTIYENILYGRPDATHDEVVAAAEAAEALDFILNLPNGFESSIGERGLKLSGGQKQRISIARAVLKNPPILIMDEATSSVDNETEGAIQRSIDRISKGRTTVIIAHRMSTIRHVDQIYLLDNGRVEEQGTHEELLALDGGYAVLWKLQTGEREYKQNRNGSIITLKNKNQNNQSLGKNNLSNNDPNNSGQSSKNTELQN